MSQTRGGDEGGGGALLGKLVEDLPICLFIYLWVKGRKWVRKNPHRNSNPIRLRDKVIRQADNNVFRRRFGKNYLHH